MKQAFFFISAAAAIATAAVFLFQQSRKKQCLPVMKFNDLYADNDCDTKLSIYC